MAHVVRCIEESSSGSDKHASRIPGKAWMKRCSCGEKCWYALLFIVYDTPISTDPDCETPTIPTCENDHRGPSEFGEPCDPITIMGTKIPDGWESRYCRGQKISIISDSPDETVLSVPLDASYTDADCVEQVSGLSFDVTVGENTHGWAYKGTLTTAGEPLWHIFQFSFKGPSSPPYCSVHNSPGDSSTPGRFGLTKKYVKQERKSNFPDDVNPCLPVCGNPPYGDADDPSGCPGGTSEPTGTPLDDIGVPLNPGPAKWRDADELVRSTLGIDIMWNSYTMLPCIPPAVDSGCEDARACGFGWIDAFFSDPPDESIPPGPYACPPDSGADVPTDAKFPMFFTSFTPFIYAGPTPPNEELVGSCSFGTGSYHKFSECLFDRGREYCFLDLVNVLEICDTERRILKAIFTSPSDPITTDTRFDLDVTYKDLYNNDVVDGSRVNPSWLLRDTDGHYDDDHRWADVDAEPDLRAITGAFEYTSVVRNSFGNYTITGVRLAKKGAAIQFAVWARRLSGTLEPMVHWETLSRKINVGSGAPAYCGFEGNSGLIVKINETILDGVNPLHGEILDAADTDWGERNVCDGATNVIAVALDEWMSNAVIGAVLSGTASKPSVDGRADFNDLSTNGLGRGYRLNFTSSGLGNSFLGWQLYFNVVVDLAYEALPTVHAGVPCSINVDLVDFFGSLVNPATQDDVTLSGAFTGSPVTVTPSAGVASFNVTFPAAGVHTIEAATSGVTYDGPGTNPGPGLIAKKSINVTVLP